MDKTHFIVLGRKSSVIEKQNGIFFVQLVLRFNLPLGTTKKKSKVTSWTIGTTHITTSNEDFAWKSNWRSLIRRSYNNYLTLHDQSFTIFKWKYWETKYSAFMFNISDKNVTSFHKTL